MALHPDRGSLSTQATQIYTWWGGGQRQRLGQLPWYCPENTQSFLLLFLKQESRCVRQTHITPLQRCQAGEVSRFLPSPSPLNPRQAGQEEPGRLVDSLILGKNLTTPGSPTGLKVTFGQASSGAGVGGDHSDVFHVLLLIITCLMF